MAADRSGIDGGGPDDGDDDDALPPDPRLWFLRDPGALAPRLVLAEILGQPPGRRGPDVKGPARRRG